MIYAQLFGGQRISDYGPQALRKEQEELMRESKYAFPFIVSNRKSNAQKICELTLYNNLMEENQVDHVTHNT